MALEINNATFNAFVDFAKAQEAAGKQRAVARLDTAATGSLAGHTIKAASGDWVGIGVGRLRSQKNANNIARDLFKTAVADIFGGEDHIPDSVKDAMKMHDFGKGKPLTARRILAVKAAIDQAATQFNARVESNLAKFAELDEKQGVAPGTTGKLIETAFTACKGNPAAMEIVDKHMNDFLLNDANQFRPDTANYIQKRVDGINSNLSELKSLSTKNPAIYAAGKQMLLETGKPLPQGMFGKLVQAINSASINDLRKLSDASIFGAHKTIMQLDRTMNDIMVSSGAEKKLDGAIQKDAARLFILTSMVSRLSRSTVDNIRDFLNSETAAQLNTFYRGCFEGKSAQFKTQDMNVQKGVDDVAYKGFNGLDMLTVVVNRSLQRTNPEASQAAVNRLDYALEFDDKFVADMVALAKEHNELSVKNYIDRLVDGKGEGADAFKAVLKKKLGNINNPSDRLSESLKANANAMMNWSICGEMKKIATGQMSQFEKDVDRSGKITLINGKMNITLSKEFNTARDQLAQFIAGDEKATYGALKNDEDRNKVHLMMAMISQETEKAGENGVQHALHPRESEDGYIISGDKNNRGIRTFTFEKTTHGAVSFQYNMEKPVVDIRPDDMLDEVSVGAGSAFKCQLSYLLQPEEVDRLAKLDYTKFNDQAADKVVNNKQEMPDGTKAYAEGKMMKAVDTFSPEFKIDAGCGLSFSMTLNPTEEELMAEQIKEMR